jgi:hypothetical protein
MDPEIYRKRVLWDLATHPSTVLPAVVGLSSLMGAWGNLFAQGPALAFAGVMGLMISGGALATRWLLKGDAIFHKAFVDLRKEAYAEQDARLDALDKRLRTDDDPRPEAQLNDLRTMYRSFREQEWDGKVSDRSAVEIATTVEKLFGACIIFLERTAELWETAQKLRTQTAIQEMMQTREQILAEIGRSIQQLAKTIDGVRTLSVVNDEAETLRRIRQELDSNLDVARRVEDRMQTMEAELRQAAAETRETT